MSQQALGLQSAFVTAIGHAADEPLLQKVADKHFITPTALGQYFYDIYNQTMDELNNSKAKLISDLTKQIELNFQSKLRDLNIRLLETTKATQELSRESEVKIKNLSNNLYRTKSTNLILSTVLIIVILY